MNATVQGEDGRPMVVTMGCYGIGVSRLLSAVMEQQLASLSTKLQKANIVTLGESTSLKNWRHLMCILVPVNVKDEASLTLTNRIEEALVNKGYEVLTDDRNERVGVKFSDSDLIGLPIRITIGKKAADGIVEVKIKATGDTIEVHADNLLETLEILSKK